MDRLKRNYYLGKFLNFIRYRAPICECKFESPGFQVRVRVDKLDLYTVISVNDLGIYINRLTGKIEGVASPPVIDVSLSAIPIRDTVTAKPEKAVSRLHRKYVA